MSRQFVPGQSLWPHPFRRPTVSHVELQLYPKGLNDDDKLPKY
jgi:hypothetical protein